MIAVAISGIAVGYGIGTTVPTTSPRSTSTTTSATESSNASAPYVLTLVITTQNQFNSTVGDQPAFYVLGPYGLQSSAQINLPANELIKLVIINYDDGQANLTNSEYAAAMGVVDDRITVVNNTLVNSTMGSSGIKIGGVESVSSLPPSVISHTFTIPKLGINIPIATLSTEVAYFTIDTPGTYAWYCMAACGSGPKGLGGAMSTPGWMTGSVTVQ
jgi:hypothetical protein